MHKCFTRHRTLFGLVSMTALAACGSGGSGDTISISTPAPTPTFTPLGVPMLTGPARNPLSVLTLGMSVFPGDIVAPNYPDQAAFIADNTPARYFAKALSGAR